MDLALGKDCVELRSYLALSIEGAPYVSEFIIGDESFKKLLSIPFNCQRCGFCCEWSEHSKCKYLNKRKCEIYNKRPLSCELYPAVIDTQAMAKICSKYTLNVNLISGRAEKKPYVYYLIGLHDGLILNFQPVCKGFGKGEPLAKHILHVIDILEDFDGTRMVLPPEDFLKSHLMIVDKGEVLSLECDEDIAKDFIYKMKERGFEDLKATCEAILKRK